MLTRSDFIKELLELPSTTSQQIGPIHLNHTAETVRHFIHCSSTIWSKQYAIRLTAGDYEDLLKLCDFFQAAVVEQLVVKSIAAAMKSKVYDSKLNAWEIFRFAANRNNYALAKLAVGCFDRAGVNKDSMASAQPPSLYSDIPVRYIYHLFRSC